MHATQAGNSKPRCSQSPQDSSLWYSGWFYDVNNNSHLIMLARRGSFLVVLIARCPIWNTTKGTWNLAPGLLVQPGSPVEGHPLPFNSSQTGSFLGHTQVLCALQRPLHWEHRYSSHKQMGSPHLFFITPQRSPLWPSYLNQPCCCSVTKSRPNLCHPMDCSTPGFPGLRHFPEFAQTHVHWVRDAIQPSHLLSPSSLSVFNLS